jgi:hypothetical protein
MAPRKSSPKRKSPKRSPSRSPKRTVGADIQPSVEILKTMSGLAYVFVFLALAAAISWIYYVSKSNDQHVLGESNDLTVSNSIDICFNAVVVSTLLYAIARHNFH